MEAFKELIFSGNFVAWIILILLFLLFIKILKSAAQGLLLLVAFCACVFLIVKFFPGFAEPIVDFVRGGWLGKCLPDRPW